jgi:hypothetical protein
MQIELSIGEGIDKFCILEIKMKYIKDANKCRQILKQKELLRPSVWDYIANNFVYYNILTFINEKIWFLKDEIRYTKTCDINLYKLTKELLQYKEKRFRIKSIFNNLYDSEIIEHKNIKIHECAIIIETMDIANKRISEINYLSVEYDFLYIYASFNIIQFIKTQITNPNISYKYKKDDELKTQTSFISKIEEDNKQGELPYVEIINLCSFHISTDLQKIFYYQTEKPPRVPRLSLSSL